MNRHLVAVGVLALAAAFVLAACSQPILPTDPPGDAELGVWLPDDGLEVPAAVRQRPALPLCGVTAAGDPGVVTRLSQCMLAALHGGTGAELVLGPWQQDDNSYLLIVRAAADGAAEVISRSTAPGLPPLWEVESCRVGNGERGGRVIGDLHLECGPLRPIPDDS